MGNFLGGILIYNLYSCELIPILTYFYQVKRDSILSFQNLNLGSFLPFHIKQLINDNKNHNGYYLLNVYYILGTVLSTSVFMTVYTISLNHQPTFKIGILLLHKWGEQSSELNFPHWQSYGWEIASQTQPWAIFYAVGTPIYQEKLGYKYLHAL